MLEVRAMADMDYDKNLQYLHASHILHVLRVNLLHVPR